MIAAVTEETGCLMDASGIIEMALLKPIFEKKLVPPHLTLNGIDGSGDIDSACEIALIIRTSAFGEHSALVVKVFLDS